tara:strand:+ start:5886 stop:6134 length:249 start_codon:yes stop_codon:yes gene_type:complete
MSKVEDYMDGCNKMKRNKPNSFSFNNSSFAGHRVELKIDQDGSLFLLEDVSMPHETVKEFIIWLKENYEEHGASTAVGALQR